MNMFLRQVQKRFGPSVGKKLALRLATMPMKGAIPYLGWAWIAYDVYSIGKLIGKDGLKELKTMWDGNFDKMKI